MNKHEQAWTSAISFGCVALTSAKRKEMPLKHVKLKIVAPKFNLIVLLSLLIVCIGTSAQAQQRAYVTDILRLAVRSGPGAGFDSVSVIQSGQPLEIVRTQGDWANIRLPDGKEGWVLERYLVNDPPSSILLTSLQKKHETLSTQAAALREENKELKNENRSLQNQLNQIEEQADQTSESYEKLKREAADFLALKRQYQKASAELDEKTKLSAELQKKIEKMETSRAVRWFITGAGVLVAGLLIGLSMRRQRRRPSLL